MAFFRAMGKGVASNAAAHKNTLFKVLGVGAPTKKAAKDAKEAMKVLGGEEMKNLSKSISQADEGIGGVMESILKGRDDISAKDVKKHVNSTLGAYNDEISWLKGLSGDELTARTKEIQNTHVQNLANTLGADTDAASALLGTTAHRNNLINKQADAYGKAMGAPLNLAKTYLKDGGPLATYAKVAVPLTAMQFANGSRTSLTEQNGQRDIAGIPFI